MFIILLISIITLIDSHILITALNIVVVLTYAFLPHWWGQWFNQPSSFLENIFELAFKWCLINHALVIDLDYVIYNEKWINKRQYFFMIILHALQQAVKKGQKFHRSMTTVTLITINLNPN